MSELFATVNPDESVLNADGYVGVDPIYQNHANDTDSPEPVGEVVEEAEDETPVTPEAPKVPKATK